MLEALILAVVIAYAIKKAAEGAHVHWQSSKTANRRSTRGQPVRRRAASAVQHDVGYWVQQVVNGFPQIRHGLAAGWHAGRTAQAQGNAARQQARTEHLEHRARLIPEIREHRRRQEEALRQIRAAAQPGPAEPGEVCWLCGRPVSGDEPGAAAHERCLEVYDRDNARREIRDNRPLEVVEPDLRSRGRCPWQIRPNGWDGGAIYCGQPINGDEDDFCPQHQHEVDGDDEGAAGELQRYVRDLLADEDRTAGDPTYSWGLAGARAHWPADTREGAERWAQHMSTDGRPRDVAEYPPGGGPGRIIATYAGGRLVTAGCSQPPSPTEGHTTMPTSSGETTYTEQLSELKAIRQDAEAAVNDARIRRMVNRLDVLTSLGLDAATLSEAAEIDDALRAQQKAAQQVLDATDAAITGLQRRHGGIQEAVNDAPIAQPAEPAFYAN